jgi:hypothetical protein
MHVTVHTRRARAGALAATAALLLGTSTTALAQESGEEPVEEVAPEEEQDDVTSEPTRGEVECDAELLDDEDGVLFYFMEPGEEVTCVASGLDDAELAQYRLEFYGLTADDDWDLDDPADEPHASEDGQGDAVEGDFEFTFTVPDDLVIGELYGYVWQGTEDEPTYEAEFGGIVFGELFGELTCEPDPAEQGSEVECWAEDLTEGEFDWEVHYLSVTELLDLFLGDGEVDVTPDDGGTGEADADGFGSYAFTIPTTGAPEVYFTILEQDEYLAFAFGEIVPATGASPEPGPDLGQPAAPATPKAPVTVKQPTRVDAGAGGAATGGASSTIALFGLLAATGVALVGGLRRGARARD